MANTEERLARIEGGYEHLATKADLANMENRIIRWVAGTQLAVIVLVVAIMTIVIILV